VEGAGGGTDKHTIPPKPPTMATFKIPTGPAISKNKLTYCVHKQKACSTEAPECGSITYDCEKGGMTWEWADANIFLTWLANKELEKSIELIVSQVERSDSPIWWEQCVYRCTREHTGRKCDCQRITQWERTIPLKKTGCWCCLTIKLYPDTNKILRKYDEQHDHTIGDNNLWFTRLLDMTKELVMDLVGTGVQTKVIVCGNYVVYFPS
jgi:hypothetical protein